MRGHTNLLFFGLGIGALLGCQSGQVQIERSAMLPGFEAVAGVHCESSAISNMLRYEGYPVHETLILGAGAAPGFMFERGKFPFLGGRTMQLKEHAFENLGISYTEVLPEKGKDHWKEILAILEEGHPVVLRVDMRFLPYLFGGKYGPRRVSFGWHMICLAGIDAEDRTAYVTDTAFGELQEIALGDLHKARFSSTKVMPPRGIYYHTERAPADYSPDWRRAADRSLQTLAGEMTGAGSAEEALAGLRGLEEFPQLLARLDEQVPKYLLQPVLEFMHGSIETNGTGGAAFRSVYRQFLSEAAEKTGSRMYAKAARELSMAETHWHELAAALLTLSEDRQALNDAERRGSRLEELSSIAERLFRAEKRFYRFILEEAAL
jgi:hypothetical protein